MTNLIAFNQDDTELYIDTDSGASYASISGYARMSGMSESGIRYRVNKVLSVRSFDGENVPQTDTGKGFERSQFPLKTLVTTVSGNTTEAVLIPESLIAKWIVKDNPELAGAMMSAGVRVYLHGLAGYRYQVKEVDTPNPEINRDNLDLLIDGLIQWRQSVKDYASDKPGMQRVLDSAVDGNNRSLPGTIPLCDLLGERWDAMTKGQKSWAGRTIADTYKANYDCEPEIKWITAYRPNGRPIKRKIKAYPVSFMPQIESIMVTMSKVFK